MLKLEDQVCSLESARKLKELGFEQESFFYWVENIASDNPNHWPGHLKPANFFEIKAGRPCGAYEGDTYLGPEQYYAAYTVAELGEMLPCDYYSIKQKSPDHNVWKCMQFYYRNFQAPTEAEARAKMLIHLKENNLI